MSAITFLAIGALLIIAVLCLFFWLTEGGGSVDKMRDSLAPISQRLPDIYIPSGWKLLLLGRRRRRAIRYRLQ